MPNTPNDGDLTDPDDIDFDDLPGMERDDTDPSDADSTSPDQTDNDDRQSNHGDETSGASPSPRYPEVRESYDDRRGQRELGKFLHWTGWELPFDYFNRRRRKASDDKAERAKWRRALEIGGALGVLGVLAALVLLFSGGEADTQTLDTTAPTVQESGETPAEGDTVEESDEPLSAVEPTETALFVAALIACASPTKQDAIGRWPSPRPGEEAREVAEIAAVTPVDKAFDLQCTGFGYGSYVFTMIVEGDAETLLTADGTTFNLQFVVNSTWPQNVFEDDSGFTVFVVWNRPAEVYVGSVNDSTNTRIPDATVDIVWLDASTLEATVALPGDDIDVRNVRTELSGLVQDAQERTIAQYFDVAIWNAEP